MNIFELPVHPAAELFPSIVGDEFKALKQSIQAQGQLEAIKICDRQLIDGRNRLRACEELGIDPLYDEVQINDVVQYVIGINIERRHLSIKQRAAIAAELANMVMGMRGDLQRDSTQNCAPSISVSEAADMMGVSARSVTTAKKKMKDDPKGHKLDKSGVKAKKAAAKKPKVKVKHSWIRIAVEEGVLKETSGGGRQERIKEDLRAINRDPDLFDEEHATELRKACITLRLQRDPELANATKQEVDDLRVSLTEVEEKKVDKAIRLARRNVEYEIQQRVTAELNEILPMYNREHAEYQNYNNAYEGVMTWKEYKKLLAILHSDRIQDEELKKKFDDMFNFIKQKESLLCGRKESDKTTGTLPATVAELMAMRKGRM